MVQSATAIVPECARSSAIIETAVNMGESHVSSEPRISFTAAMAVVPEFANSSATIEIAANIGESQSCRHEFRLVRRKASERRL